MIYRVIYHSLAIKKDVPRLSSSLQIRVRTAIEEKLTTQPALYGKPLRTSLKGRWSLRVGDYRVVFTIRNDIVTILAIVHRSEAYEKARGRKD